MEAIRQEEEKTMETGAEVQQKPDRAAYLDKILNLSREDQAFMEGYLYAKATEERKKGA